MNAFAEDRTLRSDLLVETRPPSAYGPSLWQRIASWFDAQLDPQATRLAADAPVLARWRRRPSALLRVQRDFTLELADLPSAVADPVLESIWRAATLHDLWHVRSEVFEAVARHFDQQQALQRMARLNAHFPTRSPRSGLVPLDSR